MSSQDTSAALNQWIGTAIDTTNSPPNTFRLAFNNVNSLGAHTYSQTIQQLADTQSNFAIDILGITEHCLNVNQPRVRNNLSRGLNQDFLGQHSLQIDCSNLQTVSPYLPGGTAILVIGSLIGRVAPHGKGGDPMGRWSYITLRRQAQGPLTIYTVYKVNENPTNDVGITAWHQQRLQLDHENRHDAHPREAFTMDLIKMIQRHQAQGHDIIVGGDFNDTLLRPRSQLLKLANSTDLTDPWIHLHPDHESFSTYSRGNTRIDAILCSHSILRHIQHIGYSPFNWLTNSDHRTLVVDFDTKALFGNHDNPLPNLKLRGIKSNDRQQVYDFIVQWHDHLAANNVFDRIASLTSDPTGTSTVEVELLDRLIGQGGDSAERSCRRRRQPMFTTRLAQLRVMKSITSGNVASLKQGRHQTPIFQSRLQHHGIDLVLATEPVSAYQQYKQICSDINDQVSQQRSLRQTEQNVLIEQALDTGNRTKAQIISTIQKQEARRNTWQMLRFVRLRQGSTPTLDRIDIPASWPDLQTIPPPHLSDLEDPKTCIAWKTVTKPEDVEYFLQIRNRGHFGQAQGTPFTESPFVDSIDWQASSDFSDQILAGSCATTISEVPQCQALIQACRAASALDLLPETISFDEFRGKMSSWRESTSTSPSGRHLGRYKALFAKGPYQADPEGDPTETAKYSLLITAQHRIAESIVAIINYCIQTGYVLERWKTIVNAMIFKDPGNYKIHRLRVIHIYEADFNLLLAIKWRQLLHHANQHNLINPGQYGGRPGCEAQSLVFLEELKYDISYTTRRTLFNFDNDATSCYDRIIVSLASLINRKYGLHRNVVIVHASTLQQAQFHIRNQHGFSDSSYSHCLEFPIYGSGQGSGNSPSIWLFISSTLFDIHQEVSHGANFVSPDGQDRVRITMVGFVDDSTGTCNDFQPQQQESLQTISQWMEHDAQVWNDLLWCSGGKLELPKCSFHALHFNFKPNGEPKPVLTENTTAIRVTDAATSTSIPIPSKRSDDPHKTLGHWKAPANPSCKEQLIALTAKARKLAILLHLSQLSRFGSTLAYHGLYIASLKYVLPQCFFADHVLDRAESKSIPNIIAQCGYNRNIALSLRYAPLSYAGCGFVRWSTLQGEGQILLFLKHWRTTTMISMTLRVALSWSQWQSGISKPILQNTRINLPHLECRWIKSLRGFLRKIHATVRVDRPRVIPPEREHDVYIMEHAIRSKIFSEADLKIVNYCRQYLHVTTVSELFDTEGTTMHRHMFLCRRPPWFDKSQFLILQQRPSDYQVRYKWQKLCRTLSTQDGKAAPFLKFGAWTHRGIGVRTRRESYITTTSAVYHWIDSHYWSLHLIPNTQSYYQPDHPTDWRPNVSSTPITLVRIPTSTTPVFFVSHAATLEFSTPLPLTVSPTIEFHDYVNQLPIWDRTLLQNIIFHFGGAYNTMSYLHDLPLAECSLYEVSDGSMANNTTTFGWMIGTRTGQRLIWGSGPGSGSATSHRAECWGKLSAARFLHHLSIFTKRPFPAQLRIISMADNKGLVTSLQHRMTYETVYPNATLKSDWDLIEEIFLTYTQIVSLPVTFEWIKGHQDYDTEYERLSISAQYNVDADTLANEYMEDDPSYRPTSPSVPASRCILQINKRTIHGHYIPEIREAASVPALFKYLRSRHHWSQKTLKSIQWKWFQLAANNYTHTDNHLMKLVYDQLPTQAYKAKQGGQTWLPTKCRHCHQGTDETFAHLLRCDHPYSQRFRKSLPLKVLKYCMKKQIPHNFQVTLVIALEDLLRDKPPLERIETGPAVHKLIHAQKKIGWHHILRGFFSNQWQDYLEYELNHNPSAKAPEYFDYASFYSGLIKLIWAQQSLLWKDLQLPASVAPTTDTPIAKIEEYKIEIRHLYTLRPMVLPEHRDDYFPRSLSDFLNRSTAAQLQNYINNYKPAIRRSVKIAKRRSTNSHPIFTFPGFHRRHRPPPSGLTSTSNPPATVEALPLMGNPSTISDSSPTSLLSTSTTDIPSSRDPRPTLVVPPADAHSIRQSVQHTIASWLQLTPIHSDIPRTARERPPHKHSRWKPLQAAQAAFRAFFTTSLSHSPPPPSSL
jgi:hypothetical protein